MKRCGWKIIFKARNEFEKIFTNWWRM